MKRVQSNIINIGFTIMNQKQEVKDGQGRLKATKQSKQGVELNQAVVNGSSAGCTFRTINGAQKSAQINLDNEALRDLLTAVNEILAVTDGE
tara:strand:+ start:1268 stop:1543 length:276 start_codon:yes stop_codon:yes gene_type:complete